MSSVRILFLLALFPSLAVAICPNSQPSRQPFFGELHLHTQYSADAATLDTRNTPTDAYRFAKGEKLGLPPFVDTRNTIPPSDDSQPPIDGVAQHPYCLPPNRCQFTATRTIEFPEGRALDFAAITDHSEFLGETNICFFEGGNECSNNAECTDPGEVCSSLAQSCVPKGYDSPSCVVLRQEVSRIRGGKGEELLAPNVSLEFPSRLPFCDDPVTVEEETCVFQAQNVWQQIQAAAVGANDPCNFTSFIAYEYTGQPGMNVCTGTGTSPPDGNPCFDTADCAAGQSCSANPGGVNNLHRNIIFRTDNVPKLPVSYVDVPTGCGAGASQGTDCQAYQGPNNNFPPGTFSTVNGIGLGSPSVMLEALSAQCNQGNNCEFISIPHNSNISGGAMFLTPQSPKDASIRGEFERLVEIFQIKGGSECRFSAQHPGAWGTFDELCDFENESHAKLGGPFLPDPDATTVLPDSYVRNALKDGLQYQQANGGINPFQLGFVGATDNHSGTPSAADAVQYAKTGAHGDLSFAESGAALNDTFILGLESNGGGLTVAWAEENTRDSIFAALKRRETFATSSTRPVVRFFGGFELPDNLCRQGDFAARGYAKGVPMGGTLSSPSNSTAPRFAVAAMMDPGWPGHKGTPLQRIQIVKGLVDKQGNTQEAVYDVAGGPNDASVNLKSCKPKGPGHADLCAVWKDPDFDKAQPAFYYARVLENPSCRWNQFYCNARGINCNKPPNTTSDQARYTEWEYQQCCSDAVPKTVQQRAWTSPIWYNPS